MTEIEEASREYHLYDPARTHLPHTKCGSWKAGERSTTWEYLVTCERCRYLARLPPRNAKPQHWHKCGWCQFTFHERMMEWIDLTGHGPDSGDWFCKDDQGCISRATYSVRSSSALALREEKEPIIVTSIPVAPREAKDD